MSDQEKNQAIIEELTTAYWMEIETVLNYIANSIDLDGVRAEEIKQSLTADIQEELTHAQMLGNRIKTIGGSVPGSKGFEAVQDTLQPPSSSTDVVGVIRGVIDAEEGAIVGVRHEEVAPVQGYALGFGRLIRSRGTASGCDEEYGTEEAEEKDPAGCHSYCSFRGVDIPAVKGRTARPGRFHIG